MRQSHSPPACRPYTQPYDRAELLADAVVHAAGIALAGAGAILLVAVARKLPEFQSTCVLIYGIGLVTMLGVSAAYHIWPVCSAKLILRRFDHAAIYLFIAATYTPFVAQVEQPPNNTAQHNLGYRWRWGDLEVGISRNVGAPRCSALPGIGVERTVRHTMPYSARFPRLRSV